MSQPDNRQSPQHSAASGDRPMPDRSDIDRLVVEHLPVALRFAQRLTGRSDTAEELVQETLCRVLERWESYRGQAKFETWMLQIVVNVERDRRRRQRNVDELPPEQLTQHSPTVHQQMAADELHEQIRQEIARLPDRQREVAVLSLGEGYSAVETAEILGISVANVHTCLHLARKRIGAAIDMDYLTKR